MAYSKVIDYLINKIPNVENNSQLEELYEYLHSSFYLKFILVIYIHRGGYLSNFIHNIIDFLSHYRYSDMDTDYSEVEDTQTYYHSYNVFVGYRFLFSKNYSKEELSCKGCD